MPPRLQWALIAATIIGLAVAWVIYGNRSNNPCDILHPNPHYNCRTRGVTYVK